MKDNTLRTELDDLLDEYGVDDDITTRKEASDAILLAIKNRLPKELEQTKEETDTDWFYGHGWNAAIAEVKQALDIESES